MSDLQYFKNIPIENLREQVIDQLKTNYAHNNIAIEEFERRLDLAATCSDRFELLKIVDDLPAIQGSSQDSNVKQDGQFSLNLGHVRNEENLVAIFSGSERKGPWRPARHSKVLAIFGGADIDYTQAYLPPGEFEIEMMCLFGGVDIIVPEGLNVELNAVPIFGGVDNHTSGEYIPGAPTLRIRAMVMFGGVDVKPKKRRKWGIFTS